MTDLGHTVGDARKRLTEELPNHDEIHAHEDVDFDLDEALSSLGPEFEDLCVDRFGGANLVPPFPPPPGIRTVRSDRNIIRGED